MPPRSPARPFLLASLILLALPASAQFVEQIDVAIANIEVVVTDSEGNPVRGLTKDDFTLYEDGKPQRISNFSAFEESRSTPATSGATPADASAPGKAPSARPRLFVVYIDIDDIDPSVRKRFFDGLRSYMDSAVREGDFVTVLTWTRRVRVALPPTSNRKQIATVMKVFAEANLWSDSEILRRTAETIVQEARADAAFAASLGQQGPNPQAEEEFQQWVIAEQRCTRLKRKIRELHNVVVSLARIDLQKVMLFIGDDVPLRPSRTCSTLYELDAFANSANAYGLTVHAFHPPGARDRSGAEQGAASPIAAQYHRTFDEAGGLLHLAHRTGGRAGVGAGESTKMLDHAAHDLATYYSLGYRLESGPDDKPRNIKVVTKDRRHRVRTRDTVMRLSETARLRDRVTTNLYLPDPTASATLTFTPKIKGTRRDGRTTLVDVTLSIPAEKLLLLPGPGDQLRGSFSVLVAAGRELGDASEVTELRQDFDSASRPTAGSVVTYSFTIRIRPDSRRLSIAVRDNQSGEVATQLVELQK